MRYLGWSFLLLMAAEVFSIILMTKWIGIFFTILLMITIGFIGISMLRKAGIASVLLASNIIRNNGKKSLYQLAWPIRYALASILFIIPGFASDIGALLLLVPLRGIGHPYNPRTKASESDDIFTKKQNSKPTNEDIIEGEYTVHSKSSYEAK